MFGALESGWGDDRAPAGSDRDVQSLWKVDIRHTKRFPYQSFPAIPLRRRPHAASDDQPQARPPQIVPNGCDDQATIGRHLALVEYPNKIGAAAEPGRFRE